MIRIIISDEFGQHGVDIRTAINIGYGSDISDQIQIIGYWNPAYTETLSNQNIIALIRSAVGVANYVDDSQNIYPRVQTFFPLGSNSFVQLNVFNNSDTPIIVTCGAGDEEEKNNTGYGNGLEFWDWDLSQTVNPTGDQSSFSNGIILGKLLKIKDTLNCSWWEARYRARMTADRTESNRLTTPWDLRNGFGKINVNAAIAFVGTIPEDAYSNELGAITGSYNFVNEGIELKWDAVKNAIDYSIFFYNNNSWGLLSTQTDLTFLHKRSRSIKASSYKIVAKNVIDETKEIELAIPFLKINTLYYLK